MARLWISLVDPPPQGFEYRPDLDARYLRRGIFALYAATVESGERFVAPLIGKLAGVIVTVSPVYAWAHRAPGLYHLAVTPEMLNKLMLLLVPVLSLVERESDAQDASKARELDLERMRQDMARVVDLSNDSQRHLATELAERAGFEKLAAESRQWLKTIFDSICDAILVHDVGTAEILDLNQAACELYGLTREEALTGGLDTLSLSDEPWTLERAKHYMQRAAEGVPQLFEWKLRHRSGRLLWVEVSLKACSIGGRLCAVGVIRDITARKRAEAERTRLELQLQQSLKMESLGTLAGGIAHDFNNLLMSIVGNADLALAALPGETPVRENIAGIVTASQRAADLCSQMLAYAGKARLDARRLDLNELVRGLAPILESMVPPAARLEFKHGSTPLVMIGDEAQMRQVVMNLVSNAADAVAKKGGVVTVSTGLKHFSAGDLKEARVSEPRPEGDYAFVEVRDTGEGIDSHGMSRIFDPFYSTKFTGRGLGLPSVQGIINSHKGAIFIESQMGKGSCFRVVLPLVADAPSLPAVPGVAETGARPGELLIVDDEDVVRVMVCRMAKALGYTAIEAGSGEEALRLLAAGEHRVVGVLLDLNMPGLGGEGTYEALRKVYPRLPVIVSSGYGELEIADCFGASCEIGIIRKPYQLAALKAVLLERIGPPEAGS